MIKELKRCMIVIFLALVVFFVFYLTNANVVKVSAKTSNLVVFGDNIDAKNEPFVENSGIYMSTDTIGKLIDENIYYDKVAAKVIVTTDTQVLKMKLDEKKMSKNMEYVDIENAAKSVDGQPYVDINLLKDVYDIKVEYNDETNTISIDKKDTSDLKVKHNRVSVYNDLSTKADVIAKLNTSNTVTVYVDSLKHNRWYKVKTDSGVIGYMSKNNVDVVIEENEDKNNQDEKTDSNLKNSENRENVSKDKLIMFWQYGSDLDTLGKTKIDGVSVVSPTWYELKKSNGEISSKFSSAYYAQAKSQGYEIWPIVTNGIDSVSYTAGDTSTMLNSEYNRENFIKNLLREAKENRVDGINIDFEAMKTEDRNVYSEFIRELVPIFRANNIKVSVDMYFVEYIDRKAVGAAADYVVLMGYDQRGAWSNEPGSIAEVTWVEQNVESLINDSKIPSEKIILGIPLYTRLWTEKEGQTKPTTKVYTMKNCKEFLNKYDVTPVYDEKSCQNYAEYKEGSLTYKLWIEDATSIKRRAETVKKYNLAGITTWRKGFETSDIWEVISTNIN